MKLLKLRVEVKSLMLCVVITSFDSSSFWVPDLALERLANQAWLQDLWQLIPLVAVATEPCVLNMCAMALTATMASDAVEMVLWPLKQQSHDARRIHRKRFRALRTVSAAPHGFFYPPPTGQRRSRIERHSHTPSRASRLN